MTTDWRVVSDDERAAKIPADERCGKCGGTGNKFLFMYCKCDACDGTGRKISNETPSEKE